MDNIVGKYRKQLVFVCIVLYTFLFVTWISYSDNPFLQDDNGLQWNPVIEAAFHQFFSTGHMPQYNFYQLKGYDIFQAGYYGLYNPLMYIAYICSLIFRTNPLCAYTYISFMIGNCVVYELGRKSGCHEILALMIVLLYSASSVFFFYSYWYYSMGNYWMIPLLFLMFMGDDGGRRSWYQYGLWMAFSVYLGNIQYTMYHWIICGITMLITWAACKEEYWKKTGTNIFTALAFSLFPLIGLMEASARSEVYNGRNTDFLTYPVKFMQYLDESVFGFRGVNLLLLCAFFMGAYYLLCDIRKNKNISYQVSILLSGMTVSLFFILFMGGQDYLLAKVLYKVPGLSSCRYLMKILLVLPGCMIPVSIYAFRRVFQENRKRKIWQVVAGYLLIMVCYFICAMQSCNAYKQPFTGAFGEKAALDVSEDIQRICDMDYFDWNNYRAVNLISGQNDNNFNEYYTETHNVNSLLVGNLGTKLSMFSLGGYDNTFHDESLESSINLYREDPAGWLSQIESEMFSVRNTISIKTLMRNIYRQGDYNAAVWDAAREHYPDYMLLKTDYQYDEFGICRSAILSLQKDGFVQQVSVGLEELGLIHRFADVFDTLSLNGVKYLFYDAAAQQYVDQLLQECKRLEIPYFQGVIAENGRYIELIDTKPILVNQESACIHFSSDMDCLQVNVSKYDQSYIMTMTYDKNLRAMFYPEDGTTARKIELCGDEQGNLLIHLGNHGNGILKIQYENPLNTCTIAVMLLLLWAITLTIFRNCGRKENEKI